MVGTAQQLGAACYPRGQPVPTLPACSLSLLRRPLPGAWTMGRGRI